MTETIPVPKDWLEELAYGPAHMGYIQGILPQQWVDFGRYAQEDAQTFLKEYYGNRS